MRGQVARSLHLTANDFGIEVELSAQIARRRTLRLCEVGISYYGRTYAEGKKINWKDGGEGALVCVSSFVLGQDHGRQKNACFENLLRGWQR